MAAPGEATWLHLLVPSRSYLNPATRVTGGHGPLAPKAFPTLARSVTKAGGAGSRSRVTGDTSLAPEATPILALEVTGIGGARFKFALPTPSAFLRELSMTSPGPSTDPSPTGHRGSFTDATGGGYAPVHARCRVAAPRLRGLGGWGRYPSLGVHRTASRPTRHLPSATCGILDLHLASYRPPPPPPSLPSSPSPFPPPPSPSFRLSPFLFRRFPDAAAVTLSSLGWRVGFKDGTPIGGTRARQVLDPKWLRPPPP